MESFKDMKKNDASHKKGYSLITAFLNDKQKSHLKKKKEFAKRLYQRTLNNLKNLERK